MQVETQVQQLEFCCRHSVQKNHQYYTESISIISFSLGTEDYIAFQLVSLTFDEGSLSGDEQCYSVVIIDDTLVEGNETLFVTLTSPEPALVGSTLSRATITIVPDPADGNNNVL